MTDQLTNPRNAAVEKPHAFLTLDALRGVAALLVVQFHTARFFAMKPFPRAYLAVDFFFMLSGFVLSYAYQRRLDNGWSSGSFFKARWIRLYPLYFLSFALGTAFALVAVHKGILHLSPGGVLLRVILGLLILPLPPTGGDRLAPSFPFNLPSWSLFYELLANAFHALLLRRRSDKFLVGVVLLSGALWLEEALRLGNPGPGAFRYQTPAGIYRVLFSYTFGCLLFRYWNAGRLRYKTPPLVAAALLVLVLTLRWGTPESVGVAFLLACVGFPCLIGLSASAEVPHWAAGTVRMLGSISYGVYILHVPVSLYFEQVWEHARKRHMEADAPWSGLAYVATLVVLVAVLEKTYDLPVRAWLKAKLKGPQKA